MKDGVCIPIPPSEFVAWHALTENELHDYEFEMLVNMDRAFCAEMSKELADYKIRQEQELNRKTKRR